MALLARQDRTLTAEEKPFARRFRDVAQAQLTDLHISDPVGFTPPNFLALFRHKCSARAHGDSTAIELKEIYVSSLTPVIDPCPNCEQTDDHTCHVDGEHYGPMPLWRGHDHEAAHFATVFPMHVNDLGEPEGLRTFGFIYREGECRGCKVRCRSKAGRLVIASERPPTAGRMAR